MRKGMPSVKTALQCPVLKETREVQFDVNVFRGVDHGGLSVNACSDFLHQNGLPTCGKDCLHAPEARDVHEEEIRKHQRELAKIGPNVIG